MSQKNETMTLVLAVLLVLGIMGAGAWWITERLREPNRSGSLPPPNTKLPSSETPPLTPSPTPASLLSSTPVASFSQVPNVPNGRFNYGGSTTWAPIRKIVDPEIQKAFPGFVLIYTHPDPSSHQTPGSGTGIQMLLKGELAFSQSSRELKPEEKQQNLKEITIGIDGIVFAVNPNLNIPGLTVDQVKGIYTGKITNWNQVGGPDLKITPYSRRKEDSGTVEFFIEQFLHKEPLGANVELAVDTTTGLRKVGDNPGGIYYASAPEVVGQCQVKPLPIGIKAEELVPPYQPPLVSPADCPTYRNKLNSEAFRNGRYPNTRQLYAIVKQNGQIEQQAGEAYANMLLTAQGQELIEKAGFVKIR